MSGEAIVLLLADNMAAEPRMETEHGLSFWVAVDGKNILFDTGQGTALPGNAASLGIDLRRIDAIALSHGHYDHTGGLEHVFERSPVPAIYMHPEATVMRYGCLQALPHKAIGMRNDIAAALTARRASIVFTTKPTQITDHVWVTGPIPRMTPFEDTGGSFFVDADCRVKDLIPDDQAMWIGAVKGIVVLLGCAHSGVVNTLDYIAKLTGASRFHAVIGGMHLLNASTDRLAATSEALKRYQARLIVPCHCTGESAISLLRSRFPGECVKGGAGARFSFPL